MEDMELQNTQPKTSGRIAEMSVLADTWSDDDDQLTNFHKSIMHVDNL